MSGALLLAEEGDTSPQDPCGFSDLSTWVVAPWLASKFLRSKYAVRIVLGGLGTDCSVVGEIGITGIAQRLPRDNPRRI